MSCPVTEVSCKISTWLWYSADTSSDYKAMGPWVTRKSSSISTSPGQRLAHIGKLIAPECIISLSEDSHNLTAVSASSSTTGTTTFRCLYSEARNA